MTERQVGQQRKVQKWKISKGQKRTINEVKDKQFCETELSKSAGNKSSIITIEACPKW
jgi:hypothetical protein